MGRPELTADAIGLGERNRHCLQAVYDAPGPEIGPDDVQRQYTKKAREAPFQTALFRVGLGLAGHGRQLDTGQGTAATGR